MAMAVAMALCLAACARGDKKVVAPDVSAPPAAKASASELEQQLDDVVSDYVRSSNQAGEEQANKVIHRTPYYFRQYQVYPETSNFDVLMQEQESLSVPYAADVTVPVQRFVTRMHRSREEAAQDTDFLRETGSETLTFEFRNGQWTKVGSMFVAELTEQKSDGQWIRALPETTRGPQDEDQDQGFFKRIWSKIAG